MKQLSELTNYLQNLCHQGYSLYEVKIEDKNNYNIIVDKENKTVIIKIK